MIIYKEKNFVHQLFLAKCNIYFRDYINQSKQVISIALKGKGITMMPDNRDQGNASGNCTCSTVSKVIISYNLF